MSDTPPAPATTARRSTPATVRPGRPCVPLGLRAALARRVLASVARRVPVDLELPDGSTLGTHHPSDRSRPVLQVVRPAALFERLGHQPKIGIGEAYVAGDWRAAPGTDLADVLLPFAERLATAVPPGLQRLRRLVDRPIPAVQRNSPAGARRNVEAHYDLSNDLFAAFLDDTLSYSSALFDDGPWSGQSLEEAQLRKVDAILDLAGVEAGMRVLEVGTGWGTLAIEAARRGARVVTVTLSGEQAALAEERAIAAGVDHLVEIRLQDYRELEGSFDAIVSVEMIESVGEEYWPAFLETLDEHLSPGGAVAIQAILMSHDRFLATRRSYGWVQKHIFPGGLIPSLRAVEDVAERHTGLRLAGVHTFGAHYAETLRRWRHRFQERWPEISRLGFDEEFRRTWEFYLAYCEAGFAAGYLDVAQICLRRPTGATR